MSSLTTRLQVGFRNSVRGAHFYGLSLISCNSGALYKALLSSPKTRDRFVDPSKLGIPQRLLDDARERARVVATIVRDPDRDLKTHLPDVSASQETGDWVGFFAAQSNETTPEFPLPDGNSETHGLFTYTLAQALQANPGRSFAQYRDAIMKRYADVQRASPTPVAVGTGLTRTMGGDRRDVREWAVEEESGQLRISAGELAGLTVGSFLAVFDNPLDDKAVGFVQISSSKPFQSSIVPAAHRGLPFPSTDRLKHAIARLTEPVVPLVIRVAMPTAATPDDGADTRVATLLAALQRSTQPPDKASAHIEWVNAGEASPDVSLVVDRASVWFAGADGSYSKTGDSQSFSVPLAADPSETASAVEKALRVDCTLKEFNTNCVNI